jgi:hypothetical protein
MAMISLHRLTDKGPDKRWSIVHGGPLVYLTCSKSVAEYILSKVDPAELIAAYKEGEEKDWLEECLKESE